MLGRPHIGLAGLPAALSGLFLTPFPRSPNGPLTTPWAWPPVSHIETPQLAALAFCGIELVRICSTPGKHKHYHLFTRPQGNAKTGQRGGERPHTGE